MDWQVELVDFTIYIVWRPFLRGQGYHSLIAPFYPDVFCDGGKASQRAQGTKGRLPAFRPAAHPIAAKKRQRLGIRQPF